MKLRPGLRTILVTLVLLFGASAAHAVPLTPQDKASLTTSLQTLSSAWVPEDVQNANNILSNGAYTQADWQVFFAEFFATRPITDDLYNYLNYPAFVWFDAALHQRLQNALLLALPARFDAIVSANRANLGGHLQNNPGSLSTLHFINIIAGRALAGGDISASTRQSVYDFYTQQVTAYPELWKASVQINVQSQPYVAIIRAQIMINLVESLPLTSAIKTAITQTLGLSGAYQQIWNQHSLLVIDNKGLSAAQLATIDSFLGLIARNLHHTGVISVIDFFGTVEPQGLHYWLRSRTGVNIFSNDVGTISENGFPADVAAHYSDLYGLALAHEINHMIDAFKNAGQTARWNQLLSQAGSVDMNYLRSQVGGSFFQASPQEFFASISNQWFANTALTLELAMSRWAKGYKEPLNQFLAFAELHAQGLAQVPFYNMDTVAVLTRTLVPVQYDANGFISSLNYNGTTYQFTRDASGNVVQITGGACVEVTATNAAHVTAGRAYTQTTGTWIKTTTWYALGSNQSLGTASYTSTKLAQTAPGYFVKGSCPAAPTVPTIGTPSASVSGSSVTVSGTAANTNGNSVTKVEVEFDGNGVWIVANGTTSWSLTKGDLAIGSHSVRARASNGTLVSAPSTAVSFTTVQNPVSVCFTAKNTAHITAGRAYQCGTTYAPQACANGSNTNLGSSSTYFPATTSIEQTGANHWVKVTSCPL